MNAVSHVYDFPASPDMVCTVRGRLALPGVVVELHHYRFRGPQGGVFSSPRGFLDLALSPRPGKPRGRYDGIGGAKNGAFGDIIFIPTGCSLYSEWGEGEQVSICCGIDGSGPLAEALGLSDDTLLAALDVRSEALRGALRRIAEEIEQPGICSEILVQAIWTEAAIALQRYLRRPDICGETAMRLSRLQLRRLEDRIEEPGRLASVAELAAELGMSSRHFFRQFKAATGQTLTAFVAARRIERAKRMLRGAETPVKVIAWQCGFESAAAFSAAFRKAVGVTPKAYRQSVIH